VATSSCVGRRWRAFLAADTAARLYKVQSKAVTELSISFVQDASFRQPRGGGTFNPWRLAKARRPRRWKIVRVAT